MPWIPLLTAAVGAVQGNQQRRAQQQQNQQQTDIAAAQTQYSPWTGIKPQGVQFNPVTGSALGGAAQGALAGAMYSSANPQKPADVSGFKEQFKNSLDSPWGGVGGEAGLSEKEMALKKYLSGGYRTS